MTRVNMLDSLQQFWTGPRLDIVIRRLEADTIANSIVAEAKETNVLGQFLCSVITALVID